MSEPGAPNTEARVEHATIQPTRVLPSTQEGKGTAGVTQARDASDVSATSAPVEAHVPSAEPRGARQPHYRELLDAIDQGVIETTPGGQILFVNRAFATMLGYGSAEDLLDHVRAAGDLYMRRDERPTDLQGAFEGLLDEATAIEVRRKDGTGLWLRARVTPFFTPTGELSTMQSVLEEVAERPLTQQVQHQASDSIESRERLLLAEALHDGPLQFVSAAVLRLDSLQSQVPSETAPLVEQVTVLLEQAMEHCRRVVVSLQSPDLEAGLPAALLELARGLFFGDDTTLELRGPQHVPLSVEAVAAAYPIMREALINARKHARARHVLIATETRPQSVVLTVQDDGIGADQLTAMSGHFGLPTMQTRTAALNGRLTITSRPGAGTSVSLEVPRSGEP